MTPNGYHGDPADFEPQRAALMSIDGDLDTFAQRHGWAREEGRLDGYPKRRLVKKEEGVEVLFEVWSSDPTPDGFFKCALSAYFDEDGTRYFLRVALPHSQIALMELGPGVTECLELAASRVDLFDRATIREQGITTPLG